MAMRFPFAESSTAPGQWVGARLSITSFATPFLPYIQEEVSYLPNQMAKMQQHVSTKSLNGTKGMAGGTDGVFYKMMESKGVYSTRGSGRIMRRHGIKAILPDICFRLVNRDGSELGTLSLALNSFVKVPQGEHCLKLQLESPLLARLPPPMMDVGMMVSGQASSRHPQTLQSLGMCFCSPTVLLTAQGKHENG